MNDVPESELLSAYLDGELTAAEQARAEELLAASPRARQLLEEFRALSTTLQSLPQAKLGEDISQQVLRLAERRTLAAPAELPRPARPAGHRLPRTVVPRALIWSTVAVVVAVVLVWYDQDRRGRERPAGDRIARAPRAVAGPDAAPVIRAAPVPDETRGEKRDRFFAEGSGRRERELGRLTSTDQRSGDATPPAHRADSNFKLDKDKPAEETAAPEGLKPSSGAVSAGTSVAAGASRLPDREDEDLEKQSPADSFRLKMKLGPAGGEKPGGADAPAATAQFKVQLEGAVTEDSAKESVADVPAGKSSGAVVGKGPAMEDAKKGYGVALDRGGAGYGGMAVGGRGRQADHGQVKQNGEIAHADAGVLLVQCKISDEAARKKVFDKLLVKNKIVWEEAAVGDGLARQAQLQLVYVVATANQIEATLADLRAEPKQFLSVMVDSDQQATLPQAGAASDSLGEGNDDMVVKGTQQQGGGANSRDNRALGRARRIMLPETELDADDVAPSPASDPAGERGQTLGDRVAAEKQAVPAASPATLPGPVPAEPPAVPAETPAKPAKSPPPEKAAEKEEAAEVSSGGLVRVVRPAKRPLIAPAKKDAPADADPAVRGLAAESSGRPSDEKPTGPGGQRPTGAPVEGKTADLAKKLTLPDQSKPAEAMAEQLEVLDEASLRKQAEAAQQAQGQENHKNRWGQRRSGGELRQPPAPTYRVLFVLRVVPSNPVLGDVSAREVEALRQNEAKAKHAAEAAPPAAQAK